jgi:hypothetical protein
LIAEQPMRAASPVKDAPRAKRGRPSKFGRPSQLVALTLPEEVVRGLHKVHPDLAWAVVKLFENLPNRALATAPSHSGPELAKIAARRSLIVVNRHLLKGLPGINIVPLAGDRAFLALEPGQGVTDLELAVTDRLEDPSVVNSERKALKDLRAQLRSWRHDRTLRFHTRTIIVVERVSKRSATSSNGRGAR